MIPVAPRHSLYHLEFPRLKHEENSNRGDIEAVKLGYHWTDHDEQLDADGVSWNTHWRCPMLHDGFFDPKGQLDRRTPITRMRSAEVARLRTPDGYRIRRSDERAIHAIDLGLGVEFEAKSPHYTRWYFRRLKLRLGRRRLEHLWVKAYPEFAHSLVGATVLGVPRVILSHGEKVAEEYVPFIDYRRGAIRIV